jgi:hypothetical protein
MFDYLYEVRSHINGVPGRHQRLLSQRDGCPKTVDAKPGTMKERLYECSCLYGSRAGEQGEATGEVDPSARAAGASGGDATRRRRCRRRFEVVAGRVLQAA